MSWRIHFLDYYRYVDYQKINLKENRAICLCQLYYMLNFPSTSFWFVLLRIFDMEISISAFTSKIYLCSKKKILFCLAETITLLSIYLCIIISFQNLEAIFILQSLGNRRLTVTVPFHSIHNMWLWQQSSKHYLLYIS